MRDWHVTMGWVLIISNAAVGVWCAAAYRWQRLKGPVLWIAVVAAQLTVFAQATIGAVWSREEGVPLHDMHALYGFSAIATVGILYSYHNSGFLAGKELLLYSGGSLFIMGLGLRNLYL